MKISVKLTTATAILAMAVAARAENTAISQNGWDISLDSDTKTLTVAYGGKTFIKGGYATATLKDETILESKGYPTVSLDSESVTDGFGNGTKYTYTFSGLSGKPDMLQTFYIYPTLPYLLTEGVVRSAGETACVEICPIVSKTTTTLPLPSGNNRVYDMPFANDNWATYSTTAWSIGQPLTSCEATVLFNVDSREGILFGSVDHSTWKSAVTVTPNGSNRTRNLTLQAGYISPRTWDVINNKASSSRHGEVKGSTVTSPRFMIGMFDDWRTALETYGEANTVLCPKYEWEADESIFGWQSWGGMEWGLNYNSVMSMLDFFERELKPLDFANKQGRCHIVLDSGWDFLNDDELRRFTARCKELGYVPGAYTTPFSYWGSEQDCINNIDWAGGKIGEMVLKANGRYRQITGMSLDPTHPKVKEWNRQNFERFRNLGFEFVKIDFMNNGSQEADRWYDPEITTGMQAYNYGLDYLKEFAGDMMLDFSIAPVFPAKAHVRRIGCDAWGELSHSMYTLNCIGGSWWLDRVYAFNDPDLMCLSVVPFSGKGSKDENEARIRYTSGIITGVTLLGGTYAYEGDTKDGYGHVVGSDEERARAVRFASNKDLTHLAREGRTFRPVEGTLQHTNSLWSQDDVRVDNEFVLETPDAFYYTVFNYGTNDPSLLRKDVDFGRLGINPADYSNVTELWTGERFAPGSVKVDVPVKDVRIYRFERPSFAGTEAPEAEIENSMTVSQISGSLEIKAATPLSEASVYTVAGEMIGHASGSDCTLRIALPYEGPFTAIVNATTESGERRYLKYLVR